MKKGNDSILLKVILTLILLIPLYILIGFTINEFRAQHKLRLVLELPFEYRQPQKEFSDLIENVLSNFAALYSVLTFIIAIFVNCLISDIYNILKGRLFNCSKNKN